MKGRDKIRESTIAEDHECSNPNSIAEEHEKKAPEVDEKSAAFSKVVPVQNNDKAKDIAKKLKSADSGTGKDDGCVLERSRDSWLRTLFV
jgi:hypothetical protein